MRAKLEIKMLDIFILESSRKLTYKMKLALIIVILIFSEISFGQEGNGSLRSNFYLDSSMTVTSESLEVVIIDLATNEIISKKWENQKLNVSLPPGLYKLMFYDKIGKSLIVDSIRIGYKAITFANIYCNQFKEHSINVFSQNNPYPKLLSDLSIELDSVKSSIVSQFRSTDTLTKIYYTITNKTSDTLVFVSNSCPSSDYYSLSVSDQIYIFNQGIHCNVNLFENHVILPKGSISLSDCVYILGFDGISGIETANFKVSIVKGEKSTFHIGASGVPEENLLLSFEGNTHFVVKRISNSRNKKRTELFLD